MNTKITSPVRRSGWIDVLRLPNLLTVPGDPLAGYMLAAPDRAIDLSALTGAVAAAFLFYTAGLISNDWMDRQEDARQRPERPIPSGRISASEALAVWVVLLGAALLVCFLLGPWTWQVGAALAATLLLYNLRFKSVRYLGPLSMGLCRGFSLLLGAAAAVGPDWYTPPVMLSFDLMLAYVASITYLAREEASPRHVGVARWTPAVVVGAGFALFAHYRPVAEPTATIIYIGGFGFAGFVAMLVGDAFEKAWPADAPRALYFLDPELRKWLVPRLIGLLLSTLLMLQGALIAASGGGETSVVLAAFILALWPFHRMLAERYYES